jgi:hypothetical protein
MEMWAMQQQSIEMLGAMEVWFMQLGAMKVGSFAAKCGTSQKFEIGTQSDVGTDKMHIL